MVLFLWGRLACFCHLLLCPINVVGWRICALEFMVNYRRKPVPRLTTLRQHPWKSPVASPKYKPSRGTVSPHATFLLYFISRIQLCPKILYFRNLQKCRPTSIPWGKVLPNCNFLPYLSQKLDMQSHSSSEFLAKSNCKPVLRLASLHQHSISMLVKVAAWWGSLGASTLERSHHLSQMHSKLGNYLSPCTCRDPQAVLSAPGSLPSFPTKAPLVWWTSKTSDSAFHCL